MADLFKTMEREMLHSEHAARCFIEAKRRDTAMRQAKQERKQACPNPPLGVRCQVCGGELFCRRSEA